MLSAYFARGTLKFFQHMMYYYYYWNDGKLFVSISKNWDFVPTILLI